MQMRRRFGSTFPTSALAVVALAVTACGASGTTASHDGSSPQRAVETFLAPFPRTSLVGLRPAEQQRRTLALWQKMCDRVDPAIRKGLRVPDEVTVPDAHTACGAVVVTMAMDTGETSGVASPSTIAGTPGAAATHGDTSIVTGDMRYGAMPNATAPQPPPRATMKILVVKRAGRWWVATPNAFNAKHASRGGLTAPELRHQYAGLLAAAR
jgi:hypothetical protein